MVKLKVFVVNEKLVHDDKQHTSHLVSKALYQQFYATSLLNLKRGNLKVFTQNYVYKI